MDDLALRDDVAVVTAVVTADGSFALGERACDVAGLVVPGAPVGVVVTWCGAGEDGTGQAGTGEDGTGEGGAGECGAGEDGTRPIVVASALWSAPSPPGTGAGTHHVLPSAHALVGELRAEGHDVVCRPVKRRDVSPEAALLVESLHEDAHPLAIVLVPRDASVPVRGSRMFDDVGQALGRWTRAYLARRVLLSAPRSFCAGVERAIEIVERALGRFGSPVYVRRQIVHNTHVVGRLTSMGAVFVDELDEVPDGAVVVLAAHGVSPAVREEAGSRESLTVIDATCPLVAKVHREARRFASRGFTIALVGHPDHEEVAGTLGEAPEQIHVVTTPSDVAALEPAPGSRVAYLTQTTLAIDETKSVVDALRARFGDVVGPSSEDICYATQNRQDALRAMTSECDLVLVVGSANSSNTARLVEVARREGVRAELVEDAGQLRLSWLDGARTIGLTAGASAPEPLVVDVVEALSRLGPVEVDERRTTTETVRFPLPLKVR